MFFQINITPKAEKLKKIASSQGHQSKQITDYSLVLDRFQPPTRIELESEINSVTQCYLELKNISDKSLNLILTKEPPQERCISISCCKLTVEPHSSEKISITWAPKIEGNSRDLIQFLDDRRIRYDVALITYVKNPKKGKTVKKKIPRIPLSKMSESKWSNTTIKSVSNKTRLLKNSEKENVFTTHNFASHDFSKLLDSSSFHLTPSRKNSIAPSDNVYSPAPPLEILSQPLKMHDSNPSETLRRETYNIKNLQDLNHITTINEENEFEDSLSPVKPEGNEKLPNLPDGTTPSPKNATFDIVDSNTTFEIPNSRSSKALFSSSPVQCGESSTAKSIIEADLWVKPIEKSKHFETINEVATPILSNRIRTRIEPTCLEFSPPVRITRLRKSPPKRIKPIPEKNLLKKKSSTSILIKKNPNIKITELWQDVPTKTKQTEIHSKPNDFDHYVTNFYNPDPLAPTTTGDPFLSRKVHYSEQWIQKQETVFTRWLNVLLSSPEHLTTDVDTARVDIAKVWQSCKIKQDDVLAETKESVSARYHTDTRLNTLRKAASAMFRRQEIGEILSKTSRAIEKGVFAVRTDRDLFRDIGLQKIILELFLSYNPLWLRIGLETVYGETIPLSSNQDLVGLTRFLLNRFFSDPHLVKNRNHLYLKEQQSLNFLTRLNKFVLKKFLCLVYFLDYAKMNKLIGHDPCLFYTHSIHKESRSILLTFSREVLAGIGDITKVLRSFDYLVHYRQTHLDEFNFAVANISTDLRNGVRLCRLMELITGERNLTQHCRLPANSRLQKLHNTDVALKALKKTNFVLDGDVDAKSIVEGHREKTLSLLWQIIYKYQLPRFEKAAFVIQRWWNTKLLYVRVKNYLRNKKIRAASVIQRSWKRYKVKQEFIRQNYEKIQTIIFIQSRWRGKREKRNFANVKNAVTKIQRWWRNLITCRPYVESLRNQRNAAVVLQRRLRATLKMRNQKEEYLMFRKNLIMLQSRWRDLLRTRRVRREYHELRTASICFQRRWRALKEMREQRARYTMQLEGVKKIQIWWRSILAAKSIRNEFLLKRHATRVIESWWHCQLLARDYQKKRRNCIKVQSYCRMIIAKRKYNIMLEQRLQAALVLQRRFRAILQMRIQRNYYIRLKKYTLFVQNQFQANIVRKDYLKKRNAAIVVQQRWRAYKCAKRATKEYQALKKATLYLQRQYRTFKIRKNYLKMKTCAIFVQEKWRGKLASRQLRQSFLRYREGVVKVQSYWRMKIERRKFILIKNATIVIQTRWRALIVGRRIRMDYDKLKVAVVSTQRRYRAVKARQIASQRFLKMRKIKRNVAAMKIQLWWKCMSLKKICPRVRYEKSLLNMQVEYKCHLTAAMKIQKWWKLKFQERIEHEKLLNSVRIIENWWLGILRWKIYNRATTKIQAFWRGYRVRKAQDSKWIELRSRALAAKKAAIPTKTLAYRSQESIHMFRNAQSVGQLIFSLLSLDTITKLLPEKCKDLCEIGMHEDLYDILLQSNRSLPSITACSYTTNILIALAEYPATRKYVIQKRHCLTVINQINSSMDNSTLLLGLLKLLWLLIQDEKSIQEIKSNPSTIWSLKSSYTKIMRKFKMESKKENQKRTSSLKINHKATNNTFSNFNDEVSTITTAITVIFNHLEIE